MEKSFFRRFGWAIYLLIFVIAVAIFFARLNWTEGETLVDSIPDLLLNLSSELIAIALIFFLVNQIFEWKPQEEHQRQQAYHLSEIRSTLEQLKNKVFPYPSRRAIYDASVNTLKSDHWKKVRVFAPVGLWREDKAKQDWLKELGESAKTGNIETVWGVFGLPPLSKDGKARPRDQVIKDLNYAKQVLNVFDNSKNVHLHFYPPTHASVGIGAIIFQRKDNSGQVAFGLSSHEHEDVVDTAFGIDDDRVYSFALDWFDDRIFWKATGAFVLQDDAISLTERWTDIVEAWYGNDYLNRLKD